MEKEKYVVVLDFMISELKLSGAQLLIYAIIYGFSQTKDQEFTGSLGYLEHWTNSSKQSVINNLKALLDKNLIIKTETVKNGVKFCSYRAK